MSGRRNRALERAVVRTLQDAAFASERLPLSGLTVPLGGVDRYVEVSTGAGFNKLYAALDGVDFLIVKADRSEPLVVLRLADAIEIAAIAEDVQRGRP
jgi:hypothetical protein